MSAFPPESDRTADIWACLKGAPTTEVSAYSITSSARLSSGFNLEIELKNIILRRVSIFEFLHSQGH
jgi:hypothetical protein